MSRKYNSAITAVLAGCRRSKRQSLFTIERVTHPGHLHTPALLHKQILLETEPNSRTEGAQHNPGWQREGFEGLWALMCGHICKAPALKAEISRELKSPFLALVENRAHTKLNEVKSYHLYIPSKRCSSITVERKPVSQAAGKTTSRCSESASPSLQKKWIW